MNKKFLVLSGILLMLSNLALANTQVGKIVDDIGLTDRSLMLDENQIDEDFAFENLVDDVVFNGTDVHSSDLIAKATYSLVKMAHGASDVATPFCSATLIGKDLLLTAAHCFEGNEQVAVRVYIPATATYQHLRVIQIQSHAKYRQRQDPHAGTIVQHDIALIRTERAIPGGQAALIPQANLEFVSGQSAIIAGFGLNGRPDLKTEDIIHLPAVKAIVAKLKANPGMDVEEKTKVFSQLMSIAMAKPLLMGEASIRLITHEQNPSGPRLQRFRGQSTCPGDSGGPTYLRTQSGRLVVIGVHSIGTNRLCQPEKSAGFLFLKRKIPYTGHDTFVSDYSNWIRSTAKQMKSQVGI
jgi:secreted trypsin-like serine protease